MVQLVLSRLGMNTLVRARSQIKMFGAAQNVPARAGPLGLLHALENLLASGRGDAGLAAAIFTGLLPERQAGFDPARCAACRAVGQRWGFRCHCGAVEEKCAPAATFAAATPASSPS